MGAGRKRGTTRALTVEVQPLPPGFIRRHYVGIAVLAVLLLPARTTIADTLTVQVHALTSAAGSDQVSANASCEINGTGTNPPPCVNDELVINTGNDFVIS